MRVGLGYDIHQLQPGRKLVIGGIEIPSGVGLLGHSDADVLLHALCDALLGAAGLGDIGEHFPDTDKRFKDADSAELLKAVWAMVEPKGYAVENVDCIIYAEAIKMSPYKSAMKTRIGDLLNINPEQVNIKAKTMEQLDAVGRQQAIAASGIVLLRRRNEK
ncbi:MAG: 2-C-methyl-D-erythritol 2,4-cyclodiphosphate synthase [Candidatus Omnitrophica bacterium]|jgi:2-C-methyl-D-erythritol 2,4-cyclodiphosphate synthase|nr:2-C-methyl-D-erythritol 2,4-cyclodiphosphate synthase [Candidatus Omnitrophota bacterium]